MQPPYTLVLELTGVLIHPDWTVSKDRHLHVYSVTYYFFLLHIYHILVYLVNVVRCLSQRNCICPLYIICNRVAVFCVHLLLFFHSMEQVGVSRKDLALTISCNKLDLHCLKLWFTPLKLEWLVAEKKFFSDKMICYQCVIISLYLFSR